MNKRILIDCLWTVKSFLSLFVLVFLSCSSLRNTNNLNNEPLYPVLEVIISEQDILAFIKEIQELKLTINNIRPVGKNIQSDDAKEFCISFNFSAVEFLNCRSQILATGLVRQMN
ncbi:hypothetical protein HDC92_002264 [Pedobacter sp. AK017]|uniref:hypothetical protein n=1 Tax=Pedobacter sp. AK017 TaxID=2723073 RepID=UPI001617FE6A|nr:hypothetical protein [Pedobacter sp. AK017]MBB5438588.1 hypothetical protein [Pedobacter sp. AK017]